MIEKIEIRTDGTPLSYKLWTFRYGYISNQTGNLHLVCYHEMSRPTTRHKFRIGVSWNLYNRGRNIVRPTIPDGMYQLVRDALISEISSSLIPNPSDFGVK